MIGINQTVAVVLFVSAAFISCTPDGDRAYTGNILRTVSVITDKGRYSRGEAVVVTVHNELASFLYAPAKQPACSVVTVQWLEAGKWVPKESCVTGLPSDPPSVIMIPPQSKISAKLGEAARLPTPQGPIVSEPVTPFDTKTNPYPPAPAEPSKPGEPIPEIPEGGRRPPFTSVDGLLEPGTYRIEVTFTVGAIRGPTETVYSKEFTVTR